MKTSGTAGAGAAVCVPGQVCVSPSSSSCSGAVSCCWYCLTYSPSLSSESPDQFCAHLDSGTPPQFQTQDDITHPILECQSQESLRNSSLFSCKAKLGEAKGGRYLLGCVIRSTNSLPCEALLCSSTQWLMPFGPHPSFDPFCPFLEGLNADLVSYHFSIHPSLPAAHPHHVARLLASPAPIKAATAGLSCSSGKPKTLPGAALV